MEYINERRRFSFVPMADGVPSPEDRERLAELAEEMKNKANEFFKGECCPGYLDLSREWVIRCKTEHSCGATLSCANVFHSFQSFNIVC